MFDDCFEAIAMDVLPEAGGMNDQDPDVWDAMMVILNEKARVEIERRGRR